MPFPDDSICHDPIELLLQLRFVSIVPFDKRCIFRWCLNLYMIGLEIAQDWLDIFCCDVAWKVCSAYQFLSFTVASLAVAVAS